MKTYFTFLTILLALAVAKPVAGEIINFSTASDSGVAGSRPVQKTQGQTLAHVWLYLIQNPTAKHLFRKANRTPQIL
jgi:hypothetical protein